MDFETLLICIQFDSQFCECRPCNRLPTWSQHASIKSYPTQVPPIHWCWPVQKRFLVEHLSFVNQSGFVELCCGVCLIWRAKRDSSQLEWKLKVSFKFYFQRKVDLFRENPFFSVWGAWVARFRKTKATNTRSCTASDQLHVQHESNLILQVVLWEPKVLLFVELGLKSCWISQNILLCIQSANWL